MRVHSECLTGDVFNPALRPRPAAQPGDGALEAEGEGVVVYLQRYEGRGIGLGHKLRANHCRSRVATPWSPTSTSASPSTAEYGIGAEILVDLGVTTMRLMTNNMSKYGGLEGYGLEIVERVPLLPKPNVENIAYLRTKQQKLGHLLHIDDVEDHELGGN